jgi:hypothetical protein
MATYSGTQKSSSRRQLVVVGLAALAIGLAAGVGASKVDLHRHNGSTASQAQPQGGSQASSLPATGSTAAEQPATVPETAGSSAPATSSVPTAASIPSLYLVGSTAQAQEVQQNLDWAAIAWQPLDVRVLVVAPEVSAAEIAGTMNEARSMEGLVPMTVEDLRTPAAPDGTVPSNSEQEAPTDSALLIPADQGHAGSLGAAGMPGHAAVVSGLSAFADVPMSATYTVYLVDSAAQASDVQQRLDQVRAAIGWQPLDATVQVVATAEDDAQAQETIARQNTMRALVGLAPLTVVDLRTPDTSAAAQPLRSGGDSSTGDGRPMGGYAEWVQAQARSASPIDATVPSAPVSDQEMYAQWLQSHTTAASPPQSPPSCPDPDVVPYSGIC